MDVGMFIGTILIIVWIATFMCFALDINPFASYLDKKEMKNKKEEYISKNVTINGKVYKHNDIFIVIYDNNKWLMGKLQHSLLLDDNKRYDIYGMLINYVDGKHQLRLRNSQLSGYGIQRSNKYVLRINENNIVYIDDLWSSELFHISSEVDAFILAKERKDNEIYEEYRKIKNGIQ